MPLPITAIWNLIRNETAKLDLSGLQLGDNEIRFLANLLGANESVESLDISNNNTGPNGAKELAVALERYNRTLKTLDITSNPIGAEGAAALAEAAKGHSSLETLNMDHYPQPEKVAVRQTPEPLSVKERAKQFGQVLHASQVTIPGTVNHTPLTEEHAVERVVKAGQGR